MKIELKVCRCLCECEIFNINGVEANSNDFGVKYDEREPEEEYGGCGNMQFHPKLPTQKILDKYSISVDEYSEIAESLEEKLSFGKCGQCA